MSDANGRDVEAMVQRAVDAKVGDLDVMLNQRVGPIEKSQAETAGGVTMLRGDVSSLRDEVVKLHGVVAQLAAELRRGRLARERRRKRRTQ